ncbi:MAG: class I SAM-dependent methyltransferase [Magnetococcales bacterium]|nr:class I SAM-dependent methyltransferase [Magnetococcales bacterium]
MSSSPATRRDSERIREHYLIEKELAARLRAAPPGTRRQLYTALYDELFARVPDHPQLLRRGRACEEDDAIALQVARLRPFLHPRTHFLEVGCGDGRLSRRIAGLVEQVHALDVSDAITQGAAPLAENMRLILSDGVTVPLPDDTIDVAYSHQLIEHLHPEDVLEQLRHIWRTLRPGGIYLCVTPNRLSGPHDISGGFDEHATGFHLHEYVIGELRALLLKAGFVRVRLQVELRARAALWPVQTGLLCEWGLSFLPYALRRRLAGRFPLRNVLGIRLVAVKCVLRHDGGMV